MATLVKDEKGNLVRFRITPKVDQGHAALEGVSAMKSYQSGDRKADCPCTLSLDSSGLLAEIKAAVAKAVPAGATLALDRYDAEYWVEKGHGGIESEAFAYPLMNHPADPPMLAYSERKCVKWMPSAAVKAALLVAATV